MTPAFQTGARLPEPVLFIHASGVQAASSEWLESVQELGLETCSHRPLEGCETTRFDLHRLGALLAELEARANGRAVLILRAGLALDRAQLDLVRELLSGAGEGDVFSALSNASTPLNPFAGLSSAHPGWAADEHAARLVALLGQPRLHPLEAWPDHFLALSPAAVRALAHEDVRFDNALSRLQAAGGRVLAPETLFLRDANTPLYRQTTLAPHEAPRPPAWGGLAERLHEWLAGSPSGLPARRTNTPLTLHITHSWGGGVARWVASFIGNDPAGRHLQLRSEGPQTGQGAGQRLSLYAGNHLEQAIDSWWLQPPIAAVQAGNPQYRAILQSVCARHGVGRVMISSLVGHSLDALATGLPTVQVLHDQFPAWPLISSHPDRHGGDLEAALVDPTVRREFPSLDAAAWQGIGSAYRQGVLDHGVLLAAPSESAAGLRRGLHPQWAGARIEVIPHGVEALGAQAAIESRPRPDGRLRLLVPGRMQAGKGARLLREALPQLTDMARVYLLGAGKEGEEFFGLPGVHVVTEYQRERLPELVAAIGPDLAALLSVVPETYSYMLSELRELGVPVLATRVGSFEERIRDGEDGWLIEASASALVKRVAALHERPAAVNAVRDACRRPPARTPAEMVAAYAALCPGERRNPALPTALPMDLTEAQLGSARAVAARRARELEQAADQQAALRREASERTRWARGLQRDLDTEIRRRERWVARLEADIAQEQRQLAENQDRLARRTRQLEDLQQAHQQVLDSRSWRMTRPLRAGRRILANARRAGAWNPLRWPLLLAQLLRNLATVGPRGTALRLQRDPHGGRAEPSGEAGLRTSRERSLPAVIPCADAPRASIVIPAYGQPDYTAACLSSIAEARCETPFEVIVVDDASPDDSAARLSGVDGLKLLVNETNQGFIHSCNRGAAEARGDFLVLLNNDTEVRDGWLDALLATFDAHPDAGLVGARLVYPDGRLQECGGLVFRDGSGWNYGRFDDPNRPEYRAVRDTDYCSGACIALRTNLFRELDGFDAHYAPAYYEDTDLAFRVRAAGYRVCVQAAVTVVHHEGVTSGTNEASGTKRFQSVNREKFRKRWAETLAQHPRRIVDPDDRAAVARARDHRLKGRVLVIDAYTPEPDQDSGSVRLTRLMQCLLDMGYGVDFLPDNRGYAGRYTDALRAQGIRTWHAPWVESRQAFLAEQGPMFDHILISRHYVAAQYLPLLRRHCPRARFIFDTVDLHYLREQRLADLEDSAALRQVARQTRRSELGVVRAADATLVVSPVEREVLERDAPGQRVRLLSNIHVVNGSRTGFGDRSDLFFVGGYQHPPNIDAACWFVKEIWPLVRERIPEARFHLIGSKAPDEVRHLEGDGVVFHGFVDDLEPFLDRCRLAVAPLRYGAGVKGKVNHSMSHGQPVVATPMAIEGMHAEHEREILVAGDEAEFAEQVARLYRDEALWNRISDAGLDNVRRHFSMQAARRNLETLFEELA